MSWQSWERALNDLHTIPAAPAGRWARKIDWQMGRPACQGGRRRARVCVCAGGPVGGAGSPAGRFSVSRAEDMQSGPRNKAFLNKRLACSPHAGAPTSQRKCLMRGQMLRLLSCLQPGPRPRGEYGSHSKSHLLLFCWSSLLTLGGGLPTAWLSFPASLGAPYFVWTWCAMGLKALGLFMELGGRGPGPMGWTGGRWHSVRGL